LLLLLMQLQWKVLHVADKQEHQEIQSSAQEGNRLWTVARLSDRAIYRQEMARHLHIMRGKYAKQIFYLRVIFILFSPNFMERVLWGRLEVFDSVNLAIWNRTLLEG
jgi:hypothetical protein